MRDLIEALQERRDKENELLEAVDESYLIYIPGRGVIVDSLSRENARKTFENTAQESRTKGSEIVGKSVYLFHGEDFLTSYEPLDMVSHLQERKRIVKNFGTFNYLKVVEAVHQKLLGEVKVLDFYVHVVKECAVNEYPLLDMETTLKILKEMKIKVTGKRLEDGIVICELKSRKVQESVGIEAQLDAHNNYTGDVTIFFDSPEEAQSFVLNASKSLGDKIWKFDLSNADVWVQGVDAEFAPEAESKVKNFIFQVGGYSLEGPSDRSVLKRNESRTPGTGSGWGEYTKGNRINNISEMVVGEIYLMHSSHFVVDNIVRITGDDTDKRYAQFVDPSDISRPRLPDDNEFVIWDFDIQRVEYYDAISSRTESKKVCEQHSETDIARTMKSKGYNYYVELEGEDRYFYFKTSDEVGPFLRTEYPNKKMMSTGKIDDLLESKKFQESKVPEDSFKGSDGDTVYVFSTGIPSGPSASDRLMSWVNDLDKDGYADWLYGELQSNEGITDENRKEIFWGSDVQDAMTLDESKNFSEQSFTDWEKSAIVEENQQVSRELNRATYKVNEVYMHHHEFLPYNPLKEASYWVVLNLQFLETSENKKIVESFGGVLDADWYCSEGYKMPAFYDNEKCLEQAWNFVQGYKETTLIDASNIEGNMFSDGSRKVDEAKSYKSRDIGESSTLTYDSKEYEIQEVTARWENTKRWKVGFEGQLLGHFICVYDDIEDGQIINPSWSTSNPTLTDLEKVFVVEFQTNAGVENPEHVDMIETKKGGVFSKKIQERIIDDMMNSLVTIGGVTLSLADHLWVYRKAGFSDLDIDKIMGQYYSRVSEPDYKPSPGITDVSKEDAYEMFYGDGLSDDLQEKNTIRKQFFREGEFYIDTGSIQPDTFLAGYLEAAFFTEEENLKEEGAEDVLTFDILTPESVEKAQADCDAFQEKASDLLSQAYGLEVDGVIYNEQRAGNDFWFTRNGHGVGYWDRDGLGDLGDKLTEIAKSFGETYMYVGDDNQIYIDQRQRNWNVLLKEEVVNRLEFVSNIPDEDLFVLLKSEGHIHGNTKSKNIVFERTRITNGVAINVMKPQSEDSLLLLVSESKWKDLSDEEKERFQKFNELHAQPHHHEDVADEKLARARLQMGDKIAKVMSPLSKEDALQILHDLGYSDEEIAQIKESRKISEQDVYIPKDLGKLAGQWYDGMSDPLYAVSSSAHAGNPVSLEIIEDAIYNVELDLKDEIDTERKLELQSLINGLVDISSISESRKRVNENKGSDEAIELLLFLENDGDLYRQQHQLIIKNLIQKVYQGKYDHQKSVKLWMYLVDAAAKKYIQEFGSDEDQWHKMFSKADRTQIAQHLADVFVQEFNGDEYDSDLVPKKYQKQERPTLEVQGFGFPLGESTVIQEDIDKSMSYEEFVTSLKKSQPSITDPDIQDQWAAYQTSLEESRQNLTEDSPPSELQELYGQYIFHFFHSGDKAEISRLDKQLTDAGYYHPNNRYPQALDSKGMDVAFQTYASLCDEHDISPENRPVTVGWKSYEKNSRIRERTVSGIKPQKGVVFVSSTQGATSGHVVALVFADEEDFQKVEKRLRELGQMHVYQSKEGYWVQMTAYESYEDSQDMFDDVDEAVSDHLIAVVPGQLPLVARRKHTSGLNEKTLLSLIKQHKSFIAERLSVEEVDNDSDNVDQRNANEDDSDENNPPVSSVKRKAFSKYDTADFFYKIKYEDESTIQLLKTALTEYDEDAIRSINPPTKYILVRIQSKTRKEANKIINDVLSGINQSDIRVEQIKRRKVRLNTSEPTS